MSDFSYDGSNFYFSVHCRDEIFAEVIEEPLEVGEEEDEELEEPEEAQLYKGLICTTKTPYLPHACKKCGYVVCGWCFKVKTTKAANASGTRSLRSKDTQKDLFGTNNTICTIHTEGSLTEQYAHTKYWPVDGEEEGETMKAARIKMNYDTTCGICGEKFRRKPVSPNKRRKRNRDNGSKSDGARRELFDSSDGSGRIEMAAV